MVRRDLCLPRLIAIVIYLRHDDGDGVCGQGGFVRVAVRCQAWRLRHCLHKGYLWVCLVGVKLAPFTSSDIVSRTDTRLDKDTKGQLERPLRVRQVTHRYEARERGLQQTVSVIGCQSDAIVSEELNFVAFDGRAVGLRFAPLQKHIRADNLSE